MEEYRVKTILDTWGMQAAFAAQVEQVMNDMARDGWTVRSASAFSGTPRGVLITFARQAYKE